MPTGLTVQRLIRQDRILVVLAATLVGVSAWLLMVTGHAAPQGSHASAHGSAGFALTFALWMGMMVAMMLPPVMPWILLFATTSRSRHSDARPYVPTVSFVAGYFSAWAGFSLAAAAVQGALQDRTLLAMADLRAGPAIGGAVLIVAGTFQLTPLKRACLRHCRNPLGYFLSHWRDGARGGYEMGLRHGLYCLGCCWALMALSFALGVLNLLWMAAVTLVLCVEKIAPGGAQFGRAFGVALILWGTWLLLAP